MLRDEFKERYTTLPLAIYKADHVGAEEDVITHYHRETELIAVSSGEVEFHINSEKILARCGDVLIIPPYALHRARTGEGGASYLCICFESGIIPSGRVSEGLESGALSAVYRISRDEPVCAELFSHIERAYLACDGGAEGWELTAVGSLSLLFGALLSAGKIKESAEGVGAPDFGALALEYISENCGSRISSKNAAAALYMSHSHFARTFKKTFGVAFESYLLSYRLEKARIQLAATKLPVTEIAFRLGFSSCSYFSKCFRERFGISPRAARGEKYSPRG